MGHRGQTAGMLAAVLLLALSGLLMAHEQPVGDAPRRVAPVPGTYALPPLRAATNAQVRDETGSVRTLHELFDQRIVVLSFIYTHCADGVGCPMATHTLSQVAARLRKNPTLNQQTRFISVSFDPARDTPEVLRAYAQPFRKPGMDWPFVAALPADLDTLLRAYHQDLETDAAGHVVTHTLRVFLIDATGRIRNEYTSSFLDGASLAADVETLAILAREPPVAARVPTSPALGGGDERGDYTSSQFATRARALTARDAVPADLLAHLRAGQLGLPNTQALNGPLPTAAQIQLGRQLFFDRRLSHNDTLSCASCHVPDQGYTSNELATPVGIEGRSVRRNSPTLLNVGFLPRLFVDARESRLEQQIWAPLLAANELGNPSIGFVLEKLAKLPDYPDRFAAAFGGQALNMETLGAALAAYQRTLIAGDSPFDRWHFGGESEALNAVAQQGFALFTGKAGCSGCHLLDERTALFTDHQLHDTGLASRAALAPPATLTVAVAPGTQLSVLAADAGATLAARTSDLGRYDVTLDPADNWRFRTPSLRNVALTAPYLHDGSVPTLAAIIERYNAGSVATPQGDPKLKALGLSPAERGALEAFLRSLSSPAVALLVRDAFAAPIGDRGPAP